MKKLFLLAAAVCLTSFGLKAQTEYMVLTKKDGSIVRLKVTDIDSITFALQYAEQLGNYAQDNVTTKAFDMAINPLTKRPVLFIQPDAVPASVVEWGESGFTLLGNREFTGVNTASMFSLAFDATGTPYTYYINANKKSEVKKLTAGTWTIVGTEFGSLHTNGNSTVAGTEEGIGFDSDNNPIVGFMASQATAGTARRQLTVSYFDGAEWLADKAVAGVSANNYLVSMFNVGATLYCGFIQQGAGGSYKLYKYTGEFGWEKICDFLPTGASQPNIARVEWAVSADGSEVYLMAGSDAAATGIFLPVVFRYRVATQQWTQVGEPIPSAGGKGGQTMQSSCRFDLALDAAGNPMVLYKDFDNNNYPTIRTLNPTSRQWNAPGVLENAELGTKEVMLKSIEPGVQYAAYVKTVDGVDKVNLARLNF